jgi:hypothetical protein
VPLLESGSPYSELSCLLTHCISEYLEYLGVTPYDLVIASLIARSDDSCLRRCGTWRLGWCGVNLFPAAGFGRLFGAQVSGGTVALGLRSGSHTVAALLVVRAGSAPNRSFVSLFIRLSARLSLLGLISCCAVLVSGRYSVSDEASSSCNTVQTRCNTVQPNDALRHSAVGPHHRRSVVTSLEPADLNDDLTGLSECRLCAAQRAALCPAACGAVSCRVGPARCMQSAAEDSGRVRCAATCCNVLRQRVVPPITQQNRPRVESELSHLEEIYQDPYLKKYPIVGTLVPSFQPKPAATESEL